MPLPSRDAWSPRRLWAGLRFAASHGRHLATLAPDRSARLHLVWASVLLSVKRKLGDRGPGGTRLRLVKGDRQFCLTVDELDDLAAVGEVLVDEEYRLPEIRDPEVIVDLGSHIGTSVVYWWTTYPGALIRGFEPDPRTFAKLRRNVGALDRVQVLRVAVAAEDGSGQLASERRSLTSSLVSADGGAGVARTRVETISLDTLVADLDRPYVDVLKIDVEGAEYDILAAATCLDRVGAVVGELHPHLIGRHPEAFFSLLKDFELEVECLSPRSWRFKAIRAGAGGQPPAP